MGTYLHTIEDIQEATSLSRAYIDRCFQAMPFLEAYREQAPDQNKYIYDGGALSVFHEIASLKQQGKKRATIRAILEEKGLGSTDKRPESIREVPRSEPKSREVGQGAEESNYSNEEILGLLKSSHEETLRAKEETLRIVSEMHDKQISDKDTVIDTLRSHVLLLTDGRSPEEVSAEREAQEKRLQELEAQQAEAQRLRQQGRAREQKREALLSELQRLDGKFLQGKRRREVIQELKNLESE